ncbi:MAG: hypothetical protein FWE51_04110 [Coriobacteriia bacterium]|nr:hypothetical protein [Coriobacteriia bacterium]
MVAESTERSAGDDKQDHGHDAQHHADDSSTGIETGSSREPQTHGTLSEELLDATVEVLTEDGVREQIQVAQLFESTSGPIPHPEIYKQYPSDVQEIIKGTLTAMTIEPSKRENQFARHIIAMMYLAFAGMVALLVALITLAAVFFLRGNTVAGLAFVSPGVLLIAVAIFNPAVVSMFKKNKEDK